MAVIIGSARSDENGKAHGGKAGDQKSGREVSTQSWYKHKKGWRVFRAKDPEKARKIAQFMKDACESSLIGYDQYQRNTLYNAIKGFSFRLDKLKTKVETDCSALARVCCAYAGIMLPDFNTASQASALLASGEFVELKGSKYTNQDLYLGAGDILVTKTKGHTAVALTNGSRYEGSVQEKRYELGERLLKEGSEGEDVKQLQAYLIELGYDLGRWGADGDFGDTTELAVMAFQEDHELAVDGQYGEKSHAKLMEVLDENDPEPVGRKVGISGNCWVRTAPNTDGRKLGVAKKGSVLPYGGEIADTGWLLVEYKGQNGWVSGLYGRVV